MTFVSLSSRRNQFPKGNSAICGSLLIIPTYNEAENLPKLVSALFSLPLDLHILIVDDNSPDGTGMIADDLAQHG